MRKCKWINWQGSSWAGRTQVKNPNVHFILSLVPGMEEEQKRTRFLPSVMVWVLCVHWIPIPVRRCVFYRGNVLLILLRPNPFNSDILNTESLSLEKKKANFTLLIEQYLLLCRISKTMWKEELHMLMSILFIYSFICLFIYLFVCLFVSFFLYSFTYLFIYLFSY